MIRLDAHTHMDGYKTADLQQALTELADHRILAISTSMDVPSYERGLKIAERSKMVMPTFGIHPWSAPRYADRLNTINPLIESSPMLGEIGLDYYYVSDRSSYPLQRKVFSHFLAAAREQDKIINIHTKGAEKESADMLQEYGIKRAIVHWYSGPFHTFDRLLDMGAYFTVGVEIEYSSDIKAIARDIPLSRLLTETDSPGGITYETGRLGMPRDLLDVIRQLAELKGSTVPKITEAVYENFVRLTQKDARLAPFCDNSGLSATGAAPSVN